MRVVFSQWDLHYPSTRGMRALALSDTVGTVWFVPLGGSAQAPVELPAPVFFPCTLPVHPAEHSKTWLALGSSWWHMRCWPCQE